MRAKRGRKAKGVSVMKDNELKLVETAVSLTLGGVGEGRVQGTGEGMGCRCSCVIR